MAGGPVNGSGAYGARALRDNPASTIIIPTMLQIAQDEIDAVVHITCLYDKYWYDQQDRMSLPVCFFYVLDQEEIKHVETSKQRVILYEPQINNSDAIAKKLADPIRPGVQQVIVDNAYSEPREYRLTVVLPFGLTGPFVKSATEFAQLVDGMVTIFGGKAQFNDFFGAVTPYAQSISKLVDILSQFPTQNTANYINKNSLDLMADRQKVCVMKMWTGFDYKFVMITDVNLKKVGREDDVFRGTITVKEMPTLTVTPAQDVTTPTGIDRNWVATAVNLGNQLLIPPLKILTGLDKF